MTKTLIAVTDIECDGQQIGKNSMRSFSTHMVCPEKLEIVGHFTSNLKPLPNATEDHDTVKIFFKSKFPDAWNDLLQNPQEPSVAMNQYLDWLDNFKAKIVFCASPISYDKAWMVWYAQEFCGHRLPVNPHTPYALADFEFKTFQAALLGLMRHEHDRVQKPRAWESPLPHTHIARDDSHKEADKLIRTIKWAKIHKIHYQHILNLKP